MQLGVAVAILNGQASNARQHLAACYNSHAEERIQHEAQTCALHAKLAMLHEQKETLAVKLKNYEETVGYQMPVQADTLMFKERYREQVTRVTSYQVNELKLQRRHNILEEELRTERDRRARAELALDDLNATMRGRILYLELWKQGASVRVERLQAELADSVPAQH